ncbi:MAG TPA: PilZ domain-containing protein [Acidimicrobiia bacterium]|nr:PilZ domain-containing protein [Acidimicrobiia bacterium]
MNAREATEAPLHRRMNGPAPEEGRAERRQEWSGIDRRRDPREPAGWLGTYMLVNHPERGWGKCRILDVSASGVGLELFGPPWPRTDDEKSLIVKLDPNAPVDECAVQLPGLVRNCGATPRGFLRVGVEFVGLSSDERRMLTSLVRHELV